MAVLAGLLAMLVYHVFASGLPLSGRRLPTLICASLAAVPFAPLMARAFSRALLGYRDGLAQTVFGGFRMGALTYLKLLGACAAAYALAFVFGLSLGALGVPGLLLELLLSSAAFGAATPVFMAVCERERETAEARAAEKRQAGAADAAPGAKA